MNYNPNLDGFGYENLQNKFFHQRKMKNTHHHEDSKNVRQQHKYDDDVEANKKPKKP